MNPEWLIVTAEDLRYERQQLYDEGKEVNRVAERFDELIGILDSEEYTIEKVEDRVDVVMSAVDEDVFDAHSDDVYALLDECRQLPVRDEYPYVEPSALERIREETPSPSLPGTHDLEDATLRDHLYGAWLGRCCGCLLGKPVEGWTTEKMHGVLDAQDNLPISSYVRSDVPQAVIDRYDIDPSGQFSSGIERLDHMPEDDDTNYTVAGLDLLATTGPEFDSEDVARYWMRNIPILRTHTAERVAYRNLANLHSPPESARVRNPYREWIGALIRADPYGYVNVGDPTRAAELAWRDARVSHVKNGIYGSMWVAAMLAIAPFASEPETVVRGGLSEIPDRSRLAEAVRTVLEWSADGVSYDAVFDRIHDQWDETNYHHWCHTISNAQIIATGLLWSEGELGTALGRTVQLGFDTDSSGATVGSVFGMMHGAEALPADWVEPLNDTIDTGIDGYSRVGISELADQTAELN